LSEAAGRPPWKPIGREWVRRTLAIGPASSRKNSIPNVEAPNAEALAEAMLSRVNP